MSFQPYDRNPSGIVFFGTSASDKLYESVSTFTYDAAQNSLRLPNGGYIGTQGDFDSISIASNGNVTLSQSLSIAGNLTVNGTTTTVNSTTVTVEDPIIFLGSGAPTTDDNLDRGIAFNWHTGSVARSGFFGFDDSIQGFTFIPIATGLGGNVVTGGGAGWAVFAGVSGDLAGNATTATTLLNTRTFSVSGETLASAQNFNGGANVTLTTALDKSAINNQVTLTTVDATNDFILIYDASANSSTGGLAKINRTNFVAGLGAMSSFNVSGVGNANQQISDGETLVFAQGPAINFTISATDTVSGTLNAGVAGNGLNMTSQVLAVGAGSGITVGADQVSVTDGSGILVDINGVHANLISYTAQSVAANAATTTASRTYPIQVDSSDKLVVNVPWTDTGMTFTISDGIGGSQTIQNTDTLTFRSGPAINFTVTATDQVSGTLNAGVAGVGLSMTNQVLAVDISEFSNVNIASGDRLLTLDSDATTEQLTTIVQLGQFMAGNGLIDNGAGALAVGAGNGISVASDSISVTAGTGISVDANGIHIDLSEYVTPAAVASGDSFLMLDSDGSTEQRSTVSQLGSYLAGTNVTAGGDGKLSVTDATVEGVVFTTANFVDSTRIDFTVTAGQSVTADLIANTVSETYLSTSVAGVGLTGGNGTALTIDLNEYSSVNIASGDRLFTIDSDNATEQLTTVVQLAQFMAGNGLGDSGAGALLINVDNSTVEINSDAIRVKDAGITEVKRSRTAASVNSSVTLSSDINLCTAGAGGITVTLPASPADGRLVYVKKIDSAAGTVIINGNTKNIDGTSTITLYHQYESVELVYGGGTWNIV